MDAVLHPGWRVSDGMGQRRHIGWAVVLFLASISVARAGDVTLAVAANLLPTAQKMVAAFEADGAHDVTLVHGSTGRLYAQIVSGAPFDVFLAADADRPRRLEADGFAAQRRGYALGRLALVGHGPLDGPLGPILAGKRVAIADPAVAPYGAAAMDVFAHADIAPDGLRLLTGESIGQVAQYVATGNAQAAFLAVSLVPQVLARRDLSVRPLPADWHRPILQEAVLLTRAVDNAAAVALWDWLASDAAAAILVADGYDVPAP